MEKDNTDPINDQLSKRIKISFVSIDFGRCNFYVVPLTRLLSQYFNFCSYFFLSLKLLLNTDRIIPWSMISFFLRKVKVLDCRKCLRNGIKICDTWPRHTNKWRFITHDFNRKGSCKTMKMDFLWTCIQVRSFSLSREQWIWHYTTNGRIAFLHEKVHCAFFMVSMFFLNLQLVND